MKSEAVIKPAENTYDNHTRVVRGAGKELSSNKDFAIEWLRFSRRDLETAESLLDAEHHEGLTGFELQQGIEKAFKAVSVFHNEKIIDTHDLNELSRAITPYICIEDYLIIELLEVASGYYRYVQYPEVNGSVPQRKQLLEVSELGHLLFEDIVRVLGVDVGEVYNDFK